MQKAMPGILLAVLFFSLTAPVSAKSKDEIRQLENDKKSDEKMAEDSKASAAETSSPVKKLVVSEGVEAREPVNEAASETSASRVYAWVLVEMDPVPATIKHVWYADGAQVGEVPLTLKGSPWRTWSSKNVWPGKWKVEVTSENGDVLASKEFTVVAPAAAQP